MNYNIFLYLWLKREKKNRPPKMSKPKKINKYCLSVINFLNELSRNIHVMCD